MKIRSGKQKLKKYTLEIIDKTVTIRIVLLRPDSGKNESDKVTQPFAF